MATIKLPYRPDDAVRYAETWAFSRNPAFYDYGGIGGDCTNFVSQCLYAGSGIMNYTPTYGWYYIDANDKSPSWTGVEFLYRFLTQNRTLGVFGRRVCEDEAAVGDVIQLGNEDRYYHSLFVVGKDENDFYVAAHDRDAFGRLLSSYRFGRVRYIHIEGVWANQ